MNFAHRYFGLLWLGFAWEKVLIGECTTEGKIWQFEKSAERTDSLVSWNYRYGWLIWVAIIVIGSLSETQ